MPSSSVGGQSLICDFITGLGKSKLSEAGLDSAENAEIQALANRG
jgi:hypothetical protein